MNVGISSKFQRNSLYHKYHHSILQIAIDMGLL